MFWSVGCSILRAEDFFCNLDVLYGDLGIGKLYQFLMKTKISAVYLFQFLVIKTLDPDWIQNTDPNLTLLSTFCKRSVSSRQWCLDELYSLWIDNIYLKYQQHCYWPPPWRPWRSWPRPPGRRRPSCRRPWGGGRRPVCVRFRYCSPLRSPARSSSWRGGRTGGQCRDLAAAAARMTIFTSSVVDSD